MKKFISILIMAAVALSVFVFPVSAAETKVVKKTVMQYMDKNLSFEKAEDDDYDCKVENNNGFIKVDAQNEGSAYWLMVYTEKPTTGVKPTITVTNRKDGSVVKSFEITVTAAKKVSMKNVKFNVKTYRTITVKHPYNRDYKLKYNKKIIKLTYSLFGYGKANYTFKGLKKGSTTVKAYIKGKLFGSFKVTVGDFKAKVKNSFKKQTIKYNKHMKSYFFENGGSVDIGNAVKNFHSDAKYTVKIKNKKIASFRKLGKTKEMPARVELYSLKTGKTSVTVYEQRAKGKKTKLGTIKLTVKKAKDNEVFYANMAYDNDGLFYENFISPNQSSSLKETITKRYINCGFTGSKFKKSEYKFSFTASPSNVLTVDKDGIFTCHSLDNAGDNKVTYTVTFADGSKAKGSGSFDIVSEDFFA